MHEYTKIVKLRDLSPEISAPTDNTRKVMFIYSGILEHGRRRHCAPAHSGMLEAEVVAWCRRTTPEGSWHLRYFISFILQITGAIISQMRG